MLLLKQSSSMTLGCDRNKNVSLAFKDLQNLMTLLPCEPRNKPSYTGCLIGILLKVYHNLHTSGQHNPLDYRTQPTSFFSWLMFYLYILPTSDQKALKFMKPCDRLPSSHQFSGVKLPSPKHPQKPSEKPRGV